MRRRALAAGTIEKRMAVVRWWTSYLVAHGGRDLATATSGDVEAFMDSRQRCGPRTRYAIASHLHAFYVWAVRAGIVPSDPTIGVDRPRLPRRLPRPARADGVATVIATAPADMAAAVALMADAGLRCCEVARLRWVDVDLATGVLWVRGKGERDRVVGIPARLARVLAALDTTTGPVLGRVLTPARVSQLVGELLRAGGLDATAHQLRHLYATRLYAATGGDLVSVQHALGHASVATTQIYVAIDPDRALDAARKLAA